MDGMNVFDPALAARYVAAGASFVLLGADVAILARGSERLARIAAGLVTRPEAGP
ncbi:hypothetical protein [Nonomuraea wenchangensis]|nr:hypothetical protein [Nonomuraea wenchangensis]